MVKIAHLSPAAMANVRVEAIKLETHADQVSKDVYAVTTAIEPSRRIPAS